MALVLFWIILSFITAIAGNGKKIGYGGCLLISLILSPLIGLIIGLASGPAQPPVSQAEISYNSWVDKGKAHMDKKETAQAIDALQTAIQHYTENPFVYYNLACLYSQMHKRDEAFFNLSTAVSKGYSKLDKIASDPDLEWLRTNGEWSVFVANGYKMTSTTIPGTSSRADQLEKLARLKSEGHLTESEFQTEKAKLLA